MISKPHSQRLCFLVLPPAQAEAMPVTEVGMIVLALAIAPEEVCVNDELLMNSDREYNYVTLYDRI